MRVGEMAKVIKLERPGRAQSQYSPMARRQRAPTMTSTTPSRMSGGGPMIVTPPGRGGKSTRGGRPGRGT